MKRPKYDKVLLTGSDEELNEYIESSGKCLVVDWRSDEGSLTDALAELLPAGWLSGEWNDDGDGGNRHAKGAHPEAPDRQVKWTHPSRLGCNRPFA